MEDGLNTARELLDHDDRLSLNERNDLWDNLKYVMSDPKADLVPAKKKLIEIKLEKATEYLERSHIGLNRKDYCRGLEGLATPRNAE